MAERRDAAQRPLVGRRADRELGPLVEFVYTPELVAALLRRWPEIVILGLNPFTARGLVRPNVETRDAPRMPMKKRYHGDGLTWAALVADVELSWYRLLGDGQDASDRLRWLIVAHRMAGRKLGEIAVTCRVRTSVVVEEHRTACRLMAKSLGYVEPASDKDG